jgi:hypothetical protein
MKTFDNLKQFMKDGHIKDVDDWNERREQAKKLFSVQLIRDLDASGFIRKILKLKKHRRYKVQRSETE